MSDASHASETVLARLTARLKAAGVSFELLQHEPVFTSEQAAEVRGSPLASGAKALVCKADDAFVMFVLPADRKLASKPVRNAQGWKSLRFASREELLELTGLAPGCVPPFASLFGLRTLCDEGLGHAGEINFNAGDHATSIRMKLADFLQVESPELGHFAD